MEIKRLVLGPIETNTYLLTQDDKALLIDPASKAERLIKELEGKELVGILLTHGHFDHIKAVDGLKKHYGCPVYINAEDEDMARDKSQGVKYYHTSCNITVPLDYLEEGEMSIGPFTFETVFTPGHSRGSSIFVFEDDIFTGDTLFRMSVGRTDLYGGDPRRLKESLRYFKNLGKDYIIHPGHEDETTLSFELINNPFLK